LVQVDPALGSPWKESVVNGMIPVDPGQTETVRDAYIHSRPKTTPGYLVFGPDGPSNKAKVTLYEEGTL